MADRPRRDGVEVRFRNSTAMADSDWLKLATGISVLTGKNNSGKSRVLKTISGLRPELDEPGAYPNIPEVRIVADSFAVETDLRVRRDGAYLLAPSRYAVLTPDGRTFWEASWVHTQAGIALEGGQPGQQATTRVEWSNIQFHGSGAPLIRRIPVLEEKDTVLAGIDRIVLIPPERPFDAQQSANPVLEPKPDASDLPQAMAHHVGHSTPESREIEQIIGRMFPEVAAILAPLTAPNVITLMYRDKFAHRNISFNDAGTGLARILHLVSCILIYKPGRVFLIDEPTTHLHIGSEKTLAEFIRGHDEHDYVIATHSPIFISAIRPDRAWLAIRDGAGIHLQPVFSAEAGRRLVFQELGVAPGDIALAERVLFVEGSVDVEVYPILLDKLGWNVRAWNCEVIEIKGAGSAPAVQSAAEHLASVMNIRYLIYLDGDKRGTITAANVDFLPVPEIENLLLANPQAVRAGFEEVLVAQESPLLEAWRSKWSAEEIARVIMARLRDVEDGKGANVLSFLAQEMGLIYHPKLHGPAIARSLLLSDVEVLRPAFSKLFE